MGYLPFLFLIFQLSTVCQEDQRKAYLEEAKWHYDMAVQLLKDKKNYQKNLDEVIRILHEIVDCYNPDSIESYKLLIQVYEEKKDFENAKKIEARLKEKLDFLGKKKKHIKPIPVYKGPDSFSINLCIKNLYSGSPKTRQSAAEILVKKIKTNKKIIPLLIQCLYSDILNLQLMSIQVLAESGIEEALPHFLYLLKSGLPEVKVSTIKALSTYKKLDKIIPAIIECFSDPYYDHYLQKHEVREAAIDTIARFKEKSLPYLTKLFKSEDEILISSALEAIGRMEPIPQEALNYFTNFLGHKSDLVVISALNGLDKLKYCDEKIFPQIDTLSKSYKQEIRYASLKLLENTTNPKATSILLDRLENENIEEVLNEAIRVCGNFKDQKVEEKILKIAKDSEKSTITRWYAIKTLGKIISKDGYNRLLRELNSDDIWRRSAAAVSLKIPDEPKMIKELKIETKKILTEKEKTLNELALKFSIQNNIPYEEARIASIQKALEFLRSKQTDDGDFQNDFFPLGATQLALLCFLQAGYKEDDIVVKKALEFMFKYEQENGAFKCELEEKGKKPSYNTSLAVMILSLTKNENYKEKIRRSIEWLKLCQDIDGGFGYYPGSRTDLSTTEFALLALDKAYDFLNLSKDDDVWLKALGFIKKTQNEDGGFSYMPGQKPSYGSMTASGLIGLSLCGKNKNSTEVKNTLSWISKYYTLEKNPFDEKPHHYPYYLHALAKGLNLAEVEEIVDSSGMVRNWYDELTVKLFKEQLGDGSWGKDGLLTCYYVDILQTKCIRRSFFNEVIKF